MLIDFLMIVDKIYLTEPQYVCLEFTAADVAVRLGFFLLTTKENLIDFKNNYYVII